MSVFIVFNALYDGTREREPSLLKLPLALCTATHTGTSYAGNGGFSSLQVWYDENSPPMVVQTAHPSLAFHRVCFGAAESGIDPSRRNAGGKVTLTRVVPSTHKAKLLDVTLPAAWIQLVQPAHPQQNDTRPIRSSALCGRNGFPSNRLLLAEKPEGIAGQLQAAGHHIIDLRVS